MNLKVQKGAALVVLFFAALMAKDLHGTDSGLSGTSLEFYRPALDPFGYFGVNGPRLMNPGEFYFGVSQSLTSGPFFQVAVNGAPVNIVDRIHTTGLVASLGVNNFLTVGLDVPLHLYAREANFNTLVPFTTSGLGDLRTVFKIKILRPLALLFTNTFPTGEERKFLGTSHMVPGVELIGGADFEYLSLSGTIGARFPEQKNILGLNFNDQITYGVAAKFPLGFWDPLLSVIGEIRGYFEPNNVQIVTAPVEFTVGLKKEFKNGLIISAGGGGAWNNAIGNPRGRGVFSIGYSSAVRRIGPVSTDGKESLDRIRTTVYFPKGSARPTRESSQWIRQTAEVLKKEKRIKKILVVGHTDSTGRPAWNWDLSRKRAAAVKNLLVSFGIDPGRIEIRGMNSEQPVADNRTVTGRRLNRRAEISVPHP